MRPRSVRRACIAPKPFHRAAVGLALVLGAGAAMLACSACSRQSSPAPSLGAGPPSASASTDDPPPSAATSIPTSAPSSAPSPSGLAGAPLSSCAPQGAGKAFDVGDDQPYKTLSAVPWPGLGPGDAVRIHWRREPYREKLLVSASGTAKDPVRVCGIAGPRGELPTIDGENATTDKALDFGGVGHQKRGLVTVAVRHDQRWGDKPRNIVVEGLELRNAASPIAFTATTGEKSEYTENAACVFIERGEHVVVRNNEVHGCGNGVFVASGDSEEVQSRDILVEGNYLYGNGSTGLRKDRHHSAYTEAIGIVFQWNRFGPLKEGSLGNQLKDRSAGTVVRYNWFEGGSRALDLVEPEDSTRLAQKEPSLRQTYVYGNVILLGARASSRPIHYGGDNGDEGTYRKGTLYFYDNTVSLSTTEREQWSVSLFALQTDDESADVRNNVFASSGDTHVSWLHENGTLRLGVNWVSRGVTPMRQKGTGKIALLDGSSTITGDAPGFANAGASDFCLLPSSPARGVAGPLANLPPAMLPTLQYKRHRTAEPRPSGRRDLGAFACD